MRLAFPAWRRGFFKTTGSVITEALRRGHYVQLQWRPDPKRGEAVDPAELRYWPTAEVATGAEDVVIGPALHAYDRSRWDPARLVSLDYSWEQANAPLRADIMQCFVTPYQRTFVMGRADPAFGPVLGSTQLDAWEDARPLGSPARPVLLLFACKFRVGGWRRWVYRWVGYRLALQRLRRWCDREGYALIVKTRQKHHDPRSLAHYADAVYDDAGALYPPMALRLMRSATVAVHFQSNAALELAHAGIPQYSIRLPQPHLAGYRTTREVYSGAAWTLGHWPSVVEPYDGNPAPFTIAPDALEAYRARYLGKPGATGRLLDTLE